YVALGQDLGRSGVRHVDHRHLATTRRPVASNCASVAAPSSPSLPTSRAGLVAGATRSGSCCHSSQRQDRIMKTVVTIAALLLLATPAFAQSPTCKAQA